MSIQNLRKSPFFQARRAEHKLHFSRGNRFYGLGQNVREDNGGSIQLIAIVAMVTLTALAFETWSRGFALSLSGSKRPARC